MGLEVPRCVYRPYALGIEDVLSGPDCASSKNAFAADNISTIEVLCSVVLINEADRRGTRNIPRAYYSKESWQRQKTEFDQRVE